MISPTFNCQEKQKHRHTENKRLIVRKNRNIITLLFKYRQKRNNDVVLRKKFKQKFKRKPPKNGKKENEMDIQRQWETDGQTNNKYI